MHTQKNFVFLDGLRGLAAIAVLTCHTGDYWRLPFEHAYLGVDVFFLISGFVIANAYEEKLLRKILTVRKFLLIRALRLYPMFFVSLLAGTALALGRSITSHHADVLTFPQVSIAFFFNILLLPSPFNSDPRLYPLNIVYWSLLFELVVNLLYAFLLPALNRICLLMIVGGAATLLISISFYYGSLNLGFSWSAVSILAGVTRAIFGIFFGILIYRERIRLSSYVRRFTAYSLSPWVALLLMCALLVTPHVPMSTALFDAAVVVIAFPLLFSQLIDGKSGWARGAMVFAGSASYPMYVLQVPMEYFIKFISRGEIERHSPISGIVFLAALMLFSVWIERKVDIPFRKLIYDRLTKKKDTTELRGPA
jgi:peptidoglycan/LPS O-acetylase OafA/YrhL